MLQGLAPLISTTELADAVVSDVADHEHELRVGVALGVERQRSGELRGGGESIGAGLQDLVAEIDAREVARDGLPGRNVVGGREVELRLSRDAVGGVRGAVDDGGEAEADDGRAGRDAERSVEHRRTGVRGGRAGQDHEGLRRYPD